MELVDMRKSIDAMTSLVGSLFATLFHIEGLIILLLLPLALFFVQETL